MADAAIVSPRIRKRDITLGVFFGLSLFVIFWSMFFAVVVPLVGTGIVDRLFKDQPKQRW